MNNFDINIDMGEGFGVETQLMPLIQSCNIACGGHAGNESTISELISLARMHGVKIGAHPSYPDRENFGRVSMKISKYDLSQSLEKQLRYFIHLLGKADDLHHVKPHGALYNDCAENADLAMTFIEVLLKCCPNAILFTIPDSILGRLAREKGIKVWQEAFLDRGYTKDGKLQAREKKGAILSDIKAVYEQFDTLLHKAKVRSVDHQWIPMEADTYCLHGDHPQVVKNLQELLKRYRLNYKNTL